MHCFLFVLAPVSWVNQHPTVFTGPVLTVLFLSMTLYLTVWIWWLCWWWCCTHTQTDRMYETYNLHQRLSACVWLRKRVWNILMMDKEFTAFQPYCQCVCECVCVWVTSSLTSPSCQMSFSASLSCHTPSPIFKATGKLEKKNRLGHMWSQTRRVALRRPSCPPLSHWLVYEHAYALCYDVNKDSYRCYFEICTAKHFWPRGLMLLFFVNNWRKAVCGAW